MSTPIYTATAGPADPKAPTRAKVYAGITAALGLLGVAQVFGLLSADQAASIRDFVDSGAILAASFGFGYVATKTQKQVGNGTFDEPPATPAPAPVISTGQQIVDALPSLVQEMTEKAAELERVKQAALDAFGNTPIIGALGRELIDQFTLPPQR